MSVLIFSVVLFYFFSSPFKDKHDIGKSIFFLLEFVDQPDLFLLIMEHVNILKTVFQEMSEGWREGKVVLLVFQNPH